MVWLGAVRWKSDGLRLSRVTGLGQDESRRGVVAWRGVLWVLQVRWGVAGSVCGGEWLGVCVESEGELGSPGVRSQAWHKA